MRKGLQWFLVPLLGLSSCVEDGYDLENLSTQVQVETSFAGPIGQTSVSIGELLEELEVEGLKEDGSGMLVFRYDTVTRFEVEPFEIKGERKFRTFSLHELLKSKIEEQYPEGIPSNLGFKGIPVMLKKGDELPMDVTFTHVIEENSGVVRLDSIWLKETKASLYVSSDAQDLLANSTMEVSALGEVLTVDNLGEVLNLDFSGKVVDMTGIETGIPINCKMVLKSDVQVFLKENSYISVVLNPSKSIKYKQVWGVFETQEPQRESNLVEIDLYSEEDKDFKLNFVDPKVSLSVLTNVGVPVNFRIDTLRAVSSINETSALAKFENGMPYYDMKVVPQAGEDTFRASALFGAANGSIDELLNIYPDTMSFNYEFMLGGTPTDGGNYYFTDDAFVEVGVGVEVPAWFKNGSYVSIADTVKDIDTEEFFEDYDVSLDKIVLTLDVVNNLPFEAEIQLDFMEEVSAVNGYFEVNVPKKIENDKLNKSIVVAPAIVDPVSNNVVKPSVEQIEIEFDGSVLDDIKKIRHMRTAYRIAVNSKTAEAVKVTTKDLLSVSAEFYVKAGITIEE